MLPDGFSRLNKKFPSIRLLDTFYPMRLVTTWKNGSLTKLQDLEFISVTGREHSRS